LLLTQVKLNSGLIGKVINKLDLTEESDLNEINETIKVNMKLLEKNLIERHLYNEETQEIKDILKLKNNKYRTFCFTKRLRNVAA
jgi:hypothetical protein